MDIPIQNIYFLLCYAWDKLEEKERVNVSVEDNTTLASLFAKVLVNATTLLLKRGIDREYIEHADDLPGIKGKLMLASSIKRGQLQKGRASCVYSDLSANSVVNRILVTTIQKLTTTHSVAEDLRMQLHHLREKLFVIDEIEITTSLFDQVTINRNNRIYGFIMDVCELVHRCLLPSEEVGHYRFVDFTRDENQMNRLFEKFVLNFYKIEQRTYKVASHSFPWRMSEITPGAASFLPKMNTDVSLTSDTDNVIIDTKYYKQTLAARYEKDVLQSGHLYQLTAYLINQENEAVPHTLATTGILLYPTVQLELNLSYMFNNHPVHCFTVNLTADSSEIRERLLDILFDNRQNSVHAINPTTQHNINLFSN